MAEIIKPDENNPIKLEVSPTVITDLEVGKTQKLDIRSTEMSYEVIFSVYGIAEFDRETETVIAIKPGSTTLTIRVANKLTKDVSITVIPYQVDDEVEINLHKTKDYNDEVRFIQDGKDLVDAESTNRPHKDIITNLDKLNTINDTKEYQSLGNWKSYATYKPGDIVSFLTNLYKAKQESQNKTPNPPTMLNGVNEYWELITSIKNIEIKDYNTYNRVQHQSEDHKVIHPVTNGKPMRKYKLKANQVYTMLKISRHLPIREKYGLYLDFRVDANATDLESDFRYPKIAYVEFEVHYKGFKYNRSGTLVPEINILDCNCSTHDRHIHIPVYQYFGTETRYQPYDAFGAYGIQIQSVLKRDGTIAVNVVTKYDCEVTITGEYRVTPYLDILGYNSTDANIVYAVNHLVRPGGGDHAFDDIGELKIYDKILNVKQVWDKGLIGRGRDYTLSSSTYSLLAIAYGSLINYKDIAPSDTNLPNDTIMNPSEGEAVNFNIPAVGTGTALTNITMATPEKSFDKVFQTAQTESSGNTYYWGARYYTRAF